MSPTRTSIRSFAVGIVLSIVARLWVTSSLPYGERVFVGGTVFAGLAWVVGAYYGYRAIRNEAA
jgi:hypothetical protein